MVLIIFWRVLLILFSVNGNIEGVQRLEEEEREKAKEAAAGTEQEVLEGDRDPTMTGQQRRCIDDFEKTGLWNESLCGQIQR